MPDNHIYNAAAKLSMLLTGFKGLGAHVKDAISPWHKLFGIGRMVKKPHFHNGEENEKP
jgi:hypothetical protein